LLSLFWLAQANIFRKSEAFLRCALRAWDLNPER
jgi:hypothetical protein